MKQCCAVHHQGASVGLGPYSVKMCAAYKMLLFHKSKAAVPKHTVVSAPFFHGTLSCPQSCNLSQEVHKISCTILHNLDPAKMVVPWRASKQRPPGIYCNSHTSSQWCPWMLQHTVWEPQVRDIHGDITFHIPCPSSEQLAEQIVDSKLRTESKPFISSDGKAIERRFLWHRSTCTVEWICIATEVQIGKVLPYILLWVKLYDLLLYLDSCGVSLSDWLLTVSIRTYR